jgi:hypothetical protein
MTIGPLNRTRTDGTRESFPSESLTTTDTSTFPLAPVDCRPDATDTQRQIISASLKAALPTLVVSFFFTF